MKHLFILLTTALFLSLQVTGQKKQTLIGEYNLPLPSSNEKFVMIKMPYATADAIEITGDTEGLKKGGDIFIDVVCTDYPAKLSLEALNKKRYQEVFKLFPFIRSSQIQQTNFLRQTLGAEKENALTMFHGIVIKYRPVQNEETMKNDILKLDELVSGRPAIETKKTPEKEIVITKDSVVKTLPGTSKKVSDKKDTLLKREKHHNYSASVGSETMSLKKAYKRGYITKDDYKELKKEEVDYYVTPEMTATTATIYFDSGTPLEKAVPLYQPSLPDSTVFKIFTRNRWKNITVVGDVTGSMYPYTGQLLIWLKLHSLDSLTNKFAFFNDGDNTPDNQKKIGKTGGIYYRLCNNFEEVQELVKNTMIRGGGGDCPENNIEALLLAEKQFPEADCQVLIADNWANIKDQALVNKLTKPVRIIVCGTNDYFINLDYLNLALKTKGSVHLMEQDLYDLSLLHEGEIITIGKKKFKIQKGEFIDLNKDIDPYTKGITL